MIDVQALDRLKAMRLLGMAEYFENLAATTGAQRPTGPEMVKMAVDWEYERHRNSKLHRLRRHAALAQPAADIADIKAMPGRSGLRAGQQGLPAVPHRALPAGRRAV